MVFKWDGHTHTKFCYHGNPAETPLYLERAIERGFQRYTISEHPPLPEQWVADPELMAELAMPLEELPVYLAYAEEMKKRYEERLEVTVGLEMDYLHGREDFSNELLGRCGDRLEDVLVSVHYLPGRGGIRCLDYKADDFRDGLLSYYGTMDAVVNEYYNHVEQAIEWAAALPMRKRLGHVQLIEKFREALPPIDPELVERRLAGLLPKLEAAGLGIDVNVAGLRVPTCGQAYTPQGFLEACAERGIPLVYGSDTHKPEHVGADWAWFEAAVGGLKR
ncbi:histidinol-phosphatase HisJ [Paenibacillus lutrae]|uniref:Histidinol-phosphatase n=1 Tax=Paenibacillus lutrae TaxID=2078573 RepID=A0A7X3FLL5_9BACL|nr:histidinol-phosphatase HisJ [Paenibacillus lutrae]MVP01976.1 histidinol-phosphatase HisJ [Paenibacillus lutrae]